MQAAVSVEQNDYEAAIQAARSKSRHSAEWFLTKILRSKHHDPWQVQLIEAVDDVFRKRSGLPTKYNHHGKRRFAVRSGHGPGKTTTMAMLAHYFGFICKCQIVATATKYSQVTNRLWPRFRMIRNAAIDEYKFIMDVKSEKIEWGGNPDHKMWPETATQPENLQGVHPNGVSDWVLFIVDEASGVSDRMFEVIQGALATGRGILVLIGNPTQNSGEFYQAFNRAVVADTYYQVHVKPEDSSHMDPEEGQRYIRRYGENSPVTQVRWFGNFAETAENQLIPMAWVMAAFDKEEFNDGSFPTLRVAVDVADGGDDETVIMGGKLYETCTHMLKMSRHSFISSESPVLSADAAEAMFIKLGGDKSKDHFVVDALGVGAGTAGVLLSRGYQVITYKGGESSDNQKMWRCRRVQSYLVLRDEYAAGRISYAQDFAETRQDIDDLTDQLCSIRTKPGIEKVEDLETKKDHVSRTQKSPDLADIHAMMFATQTPKTGSMALQEGMVISTVESESAHVVW